MGSTGTGKFTDYTGSKSKKTGGPGGSSGEDPCDAPILASLEDVERCAYYISHKELPAVNTAVSISLEKRVRVISGGEVIGYLPTKYNYLAGCLKTGVEYRGKVTLSVREPIAKVQVRLSRV